ncbi:hypothetical protein, partial [Citrobacter sp. R1]|uniref:hypothetical protein n=1 Tax=Citrobacter sp. R1 TaxID=2998561 RepID=UPI00227A6F55
INESSCSPIVTLVVLAITPPVLTINTIIGILAPGVNEYTQTDFAPFLPDWFFSLLLAMK